MPSIIFYFQLHQPFRLHPDRDKFLWDEENREIFLKSSERSYIPAIRMFTDLIRHYPEFRITLSMSGTFLEQAQLYHPGVINALWTLLDAGKDRQQVEFLDEPYYHSLACLFADPHKQEFRDQVSLHRERMRKLFGIFPLSFRNTELIYNNPLADVVADMGYASILCEQRDDPLTVQEIGSIPSNRVFRARDTSLIVLPRNRALSNEVACRFATSSLTPEQYAASIAGTDGEVVLLGYDLEHIGGLIREDKGIFEFWRGLPAALGKYPELRVETPTRVAASFKDCPPLATLELNDLSTSSWMDMARNTFGWLKSQTQYELFKDVESLEGMARRAGGELLSRWRNMTAADHFYYLMSSRTWNPSFAGSTIPTSSRQPVPPRFLRGKSTNSTCG